jgi:trimethylamine--corrinoid protein Co-methyltransferase
MIFTDKHIEQVSSASFKILEQIGICVEHEVVYQKALKAGAKPGKRSGSLCFPAKMVREYLSLVPKAAKISDCKGNITDAYPGSMPLFWTGAALNYINGKESRAILSSDLAEFARIADSLPSVYAVVGTSLEDVLPTARDFVGFRIMAQNTQKHLRPLLFTPNGVKPILEMAQVITNGKPLEECPLVSFGYSCLSPLHWSNIPIEMWIQSSGHKIPVMVNGEPISGSTSPVTLAGSIALSNAEILAGVMLIQLLEPGRPAIYNLGFAHTTEMRSGTCMSGTAECALMAYAGGRLAAHYNLPSASWMCTDSFMDDQQAAIEKVLTGFAHTIGGINVIWGMGQLQSQKALSPVQLVMDNEVALAMQRWHRGFEVNEETLAYNVINDVVENKGDFLCSDHTMAHFRNEISESPLLARTNRDKWEAQGTKSLSDKAESYVKEYLKSPAKQYLNDNQLADIMKIEKAAMKTI